MTGPDSRQVHQLRRSQHDRSWFPSSGCGSGSDAETYERQRECNRCSQWRGAGSSLAAVWLNFIQFLLKKLGKIANPMMNLSIWSTPRQDLARCPLCQTWFCSRKRAERADLWWSLVCQIRVLRLFVLASFTAGFSMCLLSSDRPSCSSPFPQ